MSQAPRQSSPKTPLSNDVRVRRGVGEATHRHDVESGTADGLNGLAVEVTVPTGPRPQRGRASCRSPTSGLADRTSSKNHSSPSGRRTRRISASAAWTSATEQSTNEARVNTRRPADDLCVLQGVAGEPEGVAATPDRDLAARYDQGTGIVVPDRAYLVLSARWA